MCIKQVKKDPGNLVVVSDWFVTQRLLKIWLDDENYCNDYGFAAWYNGFK